MRRIPPKSSPETQRATDECEYRSGFGSDLHPQLPGVVITADVFTHAFSRWATVLSLSALTQVGGRKKTFKRAGQM